MREIIDLGRYRTGGSQVFAGRERGQKVRAAARLDEIDRTDNEVEIRVPEDIYSLNSSFFLGMFGDSVRRFGETEFRRRYRFVGEDLEALINEGIREALRTTSPL
jgi:hypothetical protein